MSGRKEKVETRQHLDREEAAVFLEDVARQVRTGSVELQGQTIAVPERFAVDFDYVRKQSKGKRQLEIGLKWRDAP